MTIPAATFTIGIQQSAIAGATKISPGCNRNASSRVKAITAFPTTFPGAQGLPKQVFGSSDFSGILSPKSFFTAIANRGAFPFLGSSPIKVGTVRV